MARREGTDHARERITGQMRPVRPYLDAFLIVAGYAVSALVWILFSDRILFSAVSDGRLAARLSTQKGEAFIVLTSLILFVVLNRYLLRLRTSEERYMQSQADLRQQELAVRQGYVDVLDAVTGGKLILALPSEVEEWLGEPLLPMRPIGEASDLAAARRAIAETVTPLQLRDTDSFMLACSEALTNAVKHAGGGDYGLFMSGECLQVLVRDRGPGIDFRSLPKATLIQGFSTSGTMGLGFTIMLEVCDRVVLATDPTGTEILLEVDLQPTEAQREPSSSAGTMFGG